MYNEIVLISGTICYWLLVVFIVTTLLAGISIGIWTIYVKVIEGLIGWDKKDTRHSLIYFHRNKDVIMEYVEKVKK